MDCSKNIICWSFFAIIFFFGGGGIGKDDYASKITNSGVFFKCHILRIKFHKMLNKFETMNIKKGCPNVQCTAKFVSAESTLRL